MRRGSNRPFGPRRSRTLASGSGARIAREHAVHGVADHVAHLLREILGPADRRRRHAPHGVSCRRCHGSGLRRRRRCLFPDRRDRP